MSEKLSHKSGKKSNLISEKKSDSSSAKKMQELSLQRMEALLKQSSMGIHILFDNISIAKILKDPKEDKDFFISLLIVEKLRE